jgi:hypothetical protein
MPLLVVAVSWMRLFAGRFVEGAVLLGTAAVAPLFDAGDQTIYLPSLRKRYEAAMSPAAFQEATAQGAQQDIKTVIETLLQEF